MTDRNLSAASGQPSQGGQNAELERLRRRNAELESWVNRLHHFIRLLTHDLRTPLTPLLGASEMLVSGINEKPWTDLARSINLSAESLYRMVSELEDLEKCACGELELEFSLVDASDLARKTAEARRPAAETNRLDYLVDVPAGLPAVRADSHRLPQVITVLLENSIRNTPIGGRVEFRAVSDGELVSFIVIDNGIRIASEKIIDTFAPDHAPVHFQPRTDGVSLALARRLAELHGGSISFGSDGPNNLFRLSVPVAGPTRV